MRAQESPKKVFDLFPHNKTCSCIKPLQKVPGLVWIERRVGSRHFQIFRDSQTRQELFRFRIGRRIEGQWVKLWRYGIAAHGDFNGDGVRDFSWHGGDDTSDSMYVVLSSASGFRTVDVNATMEEAWTRRYGGKAPNFTLQDDAWIRAVQLERTGEEMSLLISVVDGRKLPKLTFLRFLVEQSQFVFK
ncbi:MAG: hypothetical protein C0504_13630 [Candidatus Solibacter sp.]|nr:hypothetical protein [Candidatus Solibacter sp.]